MDELCFLYHSPKGRNNREYISEKKTYSLNWFKLGKILNNLDILLKDILYIIREYYIEYKDVFDIENRNRLNEFSWQFENLRYTLDFRFSRSIPVYQKGYKYLKCKGPHTYSNKCVYNQCMYNDLIKIQKNIIQLYYIKLRIINIIKILYSKYVENVLNQNMVLI